MLLHKPFTISHMAKQQSPPGPWLKLDAWRASNGMSPAELARSLGIRQQNLTNWGKRGMPPDKYGSVAALMKISIDELVGQKSIVKVLPQAHLPILSRVPVIGTAQLDASGMWREPMPAKGYISGYLAVRSNDPDTYAVKILGDSLRSRVHDGDYVLCQPNYSYQPDDEVLIQLKDGTQTVCRFLYARDGSLTFESINNRENRRTYAQTELASVHYVAGIIKQSLFEAM